MSPVVRSSHTLALYGNGTDHRPMYVTTVLQLCALLRTTDFLCQPCPHKKLVGFGFPAFSYRTPFSCHIVKNFLYKIDCAHSTIIFFSSRVSSRMVCHHAQENNPPPNRSHFYGSIIDRKLGRMVANPSWSTHYVMR